MEEEQDLDLTNDSEQGGDRKDNRFQDLANKVKTTAEERDTAKAEAEAAKKDAEFYKGFSAVSSKYQGAADYQEKIKEKVMGGYDLEDATVSVLNKEGKFQPETPVRRESPAGGSATTAVRNEDKPLSDMTRDEKREALEQIERESGGITQILKRGL